MYCVEAVKEHASDDAAIQYVRNTNTKPSAHPRWQAPYTNRCSRMHTGLTERKRHRVQVSSFPTFSSPRSHHSALRRAWHLLEWCPSRTPTCALQIAPQNPQRLRQCLRSTASWRPRCRHRSRRRRWQHSQAASLRTSPQSCTWGDKRAALTADRNGAAAPQTQQPGHPSFRRQRASRACESKSYLFFL